MKLPVAAVCPHQKPAVILNHVNNFLNFHNSIMTLTSFTIEYSIYALVTVMRSIVLPHSSICAIYNFLP